MPLGIGSESLMVDRDRVGLGSDVVLLFGLLWVNEDLDRRTLTTLFQAEKAIYALTAMASAFLGRPRLDTAGAMSEGDSSGASSGSRFTPFAIRVWTRAMNGAGFAVR